VTAFVWEARGRAGEMKTGVMEADDPAAVESKLKLQLLTPVSVRKQPRQFDLVIGSGVTTTDIVVFTRSTTAALRNSSSLVPPSLLVIVFR